MERSKDALAAGRVAGNDPIEEITKRCIRVVANPEVGESGVRAKKGAPACVLCRCVSVSLPCKEMDNVLIIKRGFYFFIFYC